MEIKIDGKKLNAEKGETILAVAKRAGIDIPTLCHHEALEPVGACRLCVVEIRRKGRDETRIVTSCQYPAEEGLSVSTQSELVREQRQTTLSLLAARCPEVGVIRELAERYGDVIEYKRYDEKEKCILCYLCTRTCAAVGPEAIAAVGRGRLKEIAPPFHGEAEACVGCGSCARICPTGCISMEDTDNTRKIWGREFELVKCEACGMPLITKEYLRYAVEKSGLEESYYTTCAPCKQKALAERFASIGVIQGSGE
jgi:NADH dehydrogenase/NADH:ubiquinone oxidoreductase subunit G